MDGNRGSRLSIFLPNFIEALAENWMHRRETKLATSHEPELIVRANMNPFCWYAIRGIISHPSSET
jgi:hypothetical protein